MQAASTFHTVKINFLVLLLTAKYNATLPNPLLPGFCHGWHLPSGPYWSEVALASSILTIGTMSSAGRAQKFGLEVNSYVCEFGTLF